MPVSDFAGSRDCRCRIGARGEVTIRLSPDLKDRQKEGEVMPNWLIVLLMNVLGSISGPLREQIVKSVREWEVKARETESPWDDVLVGCVKWLLNIK